MSECTIQFQDVITFTGFAGIKFEVKPAPTEVTIDADFNQAGGSVAPWLNRFGASIPGDGMATILPDDVAHIRLNAIGTQTFIEGNVYTIEIDVISEGIGVLSLWDGTTIPISPAWAGSGTYTFTATAALGGGALLDFYYTAAGGAGANLVLSRLAIFNGGDVGKSFTIDGVSSSPSAVVTYTGTWDTEPLPTETVVASYTSLGNDYTDSQGKRLKDLQDLSVVCAGTIPVNYYVRADGKATLAASATDYNSDITSLNLQTLYNELAAGNIPPGSVVGLSSQGGDYAQTNGAFIEQLGDRVDSTNLGMVYFWEGITYTNVFNENISMDTTGIVGAIGAGIGITPTCFMGADDPAISRVEAQAPGSITIDGSALSALVELRGASGAGGYGIKAIGLDALGNSIATNAHDIYSCSETAELEVFGGTVTGNHRTDGGIGASDQIFTTHGDSRIRAWDTVIDGMTELYRAIGNNSDPGTQSSYIELNNITASGTQNGSTLLNIAESEVILNNCTLTAGGRGGAKFVSTTAGFVGTTTLNGCTVIAPSDAGSTDNLNMLPGSFIKFNGGSITFPWNNMITMFGDIDIEFNDVHTIYQATNGTRRFHVTTNRNRITWNRCILDCKSMSGAIDLVRMDADFTMKAGSGMFACEVWKTRHTGLIRPIPILSGDCGFAFEQCTFIDGTQPIALFGSNDFVGFATFNNCHFSEGADLITRGAAVANNCSFFGSAVALKTDFATLVGDKDVTVEGFTNRGATLPDLTIDVDTSDMYHAGGAPNVVLDRTGVVPFDNPASTGCYEGVP